MEKVKSWLHSKSCKAAVVVSGAVAALAPVASAAEGSSASDAVFTSFTTGFQGIANDALKMVAVIVPIGLSVAGIVFLSKKAMGWFKSLAK